MSALTDSRKKHNLVGEVHNTLYHKIEMKLRHDMDLIIQDNMKAHNTKSPFMMYRGHTYFHSKAPRLTMNPLILHRTLRNVMKEWLNQRAVLDEEQQIISTYLLAANSVCSCDDDLYKVTPEALHPIIRKLTARVMEDHRLPAADHKINGFLDQNQKYMDVIKRRLTLNLIEER